MRHVTLKMKTKQLLGYLAVLAIAQLTTVTYAYASTDTSHISIDQMFTENTLTLIGLIIVFAFIGSKLFNRFGIPQIVGFIVTGVAFGPSLLNIIPLELSSELLFISEIALGLIGFDIGSHLKLDELRKIGRSVLSILIFEAFGAFMLVSAGVYLFTRDVNTALMFGAISTATAPAATVDVLAEYDAKGPLTTSLLAVIGLDDALALLLFSLCSGFVENRLTSTATLSIVTVLLTPVVEIGGSLLIGTVMSLLLDQLLTRIRGQHDGMAISIGFIFLSVGLSVTLGMSLILTTMAIGFILINRSPEHGYRIRYTVEQAGPVLYVLFFALIGARFQLSLIPTMGVLGLIYVVLRTVGKYFGARVGGELGRAEPLVCKNLGLGLLSQAGVAVGLAINTGTRFLSYGTQGEALGYLIINVITASTFLVQIIGPICVKLAITRAGEIGKGRGTIDDWATETND
ncbi:cation:proton antiporter [Candidatus Bathyarchaeota archaeon]|nr:cation:proton antiporter [Candidatus Bathyarchaeota archaeon]